MKETTYEIDGVQYEAVVSESWTVKTICRWNEEASAILGKLTKFTRNAVQSARQSSPLGLADVSILARWDKEQIAFANAMENFVRENFPKVAKRLYKQGEILWNFFMNCAVAAFDEYQDERGIE